MTQYAIVNAESIITEIGDEDARDEMFSRTGHTRELIQLTREHSVGDEIDYTDRGVELYADPAEEAAYAADRAYDQAKDDALTGDR